jgi:hypothetical protein
MDAIVIVVRPFGTHAIGDVIADPGEMRDALNGEHARDVVRVAAPAKSVRQKKEI